MKLSSLPSLALIGVSVATLAALAVTTAADAGADKSAATVITVDSNANEIFAPAGAAPGLTANAAWQRFAHLNGVSQAAVPPDVTAQIGRLTLPVGPGHPGEYLADNELVWAFSWQECPPTGVATSGPGACIAWLFLDAQSGDLVDQTWQQ
jgi:hypothetical protein